MQDPPIPSASIPLCYASAKQDERKLLDAAAGSLKAAALNWIGVTIAGAVLKAFFGWYGLLGLLVLTPAMIGVSVSGLHEGSKAMRGAGRVGSMGRAGVVLNIAALCVVAAGFMWGGVIVYRLSRL